MKITITTKTITPKPPNLRRHFHDIELARLKVKGRDGKVWTVRNPTDAKGTPEVYWVADHTVEFDKDWQFFTVATNPGMDLQYISALYGDRKAFFNRKSFPGRANYILGEETDRENPQYSKIYVCGGDLLAGEIVGGYYKPLMMDGNKPPPLKPGMSYPQTVEEARTAWDRYLYNPKDDPWMFIVATNITDKGTPFPFDKGGKYSWTPEPDRFFSFLPHVCRVQPYYFLDHLQPVNEWVSPYTIFIT